MVVITAKSGTYNTKGDKIVLREHVVVTSAKGYNAKLREASVDMKKGNVSPISPVEIKLPNGVSTRTAWRSSDSGDVVRFTRGVVFNLDAEGAGGEEVKRCVSGRLALAGARARARARCAAAQPAGRAAAVLRRRDAGLSINRDQPVKIESNTLEVRDKIRQATFIGDVKLTQGETMLKCKTLVVFYEDTAIGRKKGQQGARGAKERRQGRRRNQQIKRAEAKGDVFVTQKDQTASGENRHVRRQIQHRRR